MSDEEIKKEIEARISQLSSGVASKYFSNHPEAPLVFREKARTELESFIIPIERALPAIKDILDDIKKNVKFIGERTQTCAAYLLFGKVFNNLKAILIIAREGKSLEIMDIGRSAQESLDLAFLFLEEGTESYLNDWFDGKWIKNDVARKFFDKAINKGREAGKELPAEELKLGTYNIYSKYAHSTYGAILDSVDVFREDFDFSGNAGFHYTRENFHIVEDICTKLILQLKGFAVKIKNRDLLLKADRLLNQVGRPEVSKEVMEEVIKKYS